MLKKRIASLAARRKILFSKIVVSNVFDLSLMIVVYISSMLIGSLLLGIHDLKYDTLLAVNNHIFSVNQFALLLLKLSITLPSMIVAVLLTFLLAYLTKNVVVTSVLTLFISSAGEAASKLLIPKDSILHGLWLYSNITIYGEIDSFYLFTPSAMIVPCIIIGIYTAMFYGVSFRIFHQIDGNA